MSDLQILFLVLVAIYAWECVLWLRRGAVAFVARWESDWRPVHPGTFAGNSRGGFVLVPPFPPLGRVIQGNQFPLSISPETALCWVSTSVNPAGRPPQSGNWMPFDQVRKVEARGRKVFVNGSLWLRAGSIHHAAYVVTALRGVAEARPGERARAIEKLLRDSLDVSALEKRWQEYSAQEGQSFWLTNGLFLYLFLLCPAVIWRFGLHLTWAPLLISLLGWTGAVAAWFRRAHRALYPAAGDERFSQSLIVLLSPATTIRSRDALTRPLLEQFHPLALARVFCPPNRFRELAREILGDLRYPSLPLCPSRDPVARHAEEHWRVALRTAVENFLRESGLEPETLLTSPAALDAACRGYCPRCRSQYTRWPGVCEDCGGLALLPLAGPGAPRNPAPP